MARLAGVVLAACIALSCASSCPLYKDAYLTQPSSSPAPNEGTDSRIDATPSWVFVNTSSVIVTIITLPETFSLVGIRLQGASDGRYETVSITDQRSNAATVTSSETSPGDITDGVLSLSAVTSLTLNFSDPSNESVGLRFDLLVDCADCTDFGTFLERGLCQSCQLLSTYQDELNQPACKPVSNCSDNQYQTALPTLSSDRNCDFLANCTALEFEAVPATSTSDRKCNTTATCDPDQFQTQAPTNTTDRVCVDRVGCPPGSIETAPGTNTSDAECAVCAIGTLDDDSNASTPCQSCPPGHDLSSTDLFGACTLHMCPAGTIDHDNNVSTACLACDPGSYVPPGRNGTCDEYLCAIGTVDTDSDATTPCVACGPGAYVPSNSSGSCADYTCPLGRKDDDSNASTPCTLCSIGTFDNSTGPTALQPLVPCVACPQGQFVDAPGQAECSACATCNSSDFVLKVCIAEADTVCEPCKTCPNDDVVRACAPDLNTLCQVDVDLLSSGKAESDSNSSVAIIVVVIVVVLVGLVALLHILTSKRSKTSSSQPMTTSAHPGSRASLYQPSAEAPVHEHVPSQRRPSSFQVAPSSQGQAIEMEPTRHTPVDGWKHDKPVIDDVLV
eukprot:m.100592 g.100592  ORF g.100592 m.100592 type:complete len:617 (-) comp15132_c0_seq1:103-1953(-)